MLEKIKKLFTREKKKKYKLPKSRIEVRWKGETAKYGLSGDVAKTIKLVKEGRELPYSKHYLKARKKNFREPTFDRTGGKPKPEMDFDVEVNPALLQKKGD